MKISLCLNFFPPTCPKAKFGKNSIYSNKFFHNFHFSESSFTYPGLRASGNDLISENKMLFTYEEFKNHYNIRLNFKFYRIFQYSKCHST